MDTLIANVAKKKGIRTGVVNAAYDLTNKEPTVSETPISETVTKTVGVSGDFNDVNDALEWAEGSTTSGGAQIVIELPIGTHLLSPHTDRLFYGLENVILRAAQGGDATTVKITLDPTFVASNGYFDGFYFSGNSQIRKLTIDPLLGGHSGMPYIAMYAVESGFLRVDSCVINNTYVCLNCNGVAEVASTTMSNSVDAAIYVSASGRCAGSSLTFTANSADTNVPLNEVQYGGSYISDGTAALSFKA